MKNLELTQMEDLQGGGPCFNEVACGTIAVAAGFFAPVVGSIAISGVCMFLVESDGGETNGGAEWR
ncbi:hypothetical protein [Psychroflexus maritimus]|uniref:Uncharacterized protein n=1 Tax=Psychroflexus maritimus TaxID=2714865 RepID=A0A967AF72_9FLAO|nr:hypothetical protein [Psychroflexus maritimus]NGZ90133.1 hypothetical protein [Psychroflexus maritimus]